jgi:hypothetical protein
MDKETNARESRWIPYVLPWDDAPLDLSSLYTAEKPAGKHGFLRAEGDRLVFEDGCEARFWGTLFNGAANFPSHEYSEKVARRLAKFGVNMVRTHQLDADWTTPNIFQYTRGRHRNDSLTLDPESMDRLDYLIACLKAQGIYIYLDQLCHRKFKPGDGVDNVDGLHKYGGTPQSLFDPRMMELQKEYSRRLWTHVNPYTGLAYKDDPAIALMELTNENDTFRANRNLEPYRTRLEKRYRDWADNEGRSVPEGSVDFDKLTPDLTCFLTDLFKAYCDEMTANLRVIGVRTPITGTNWNTWSGLCGFWAMRDCDYMDSHAYWDMWNDVRGNNVPAIGLENDPLVQPLSARRRLTRPFFVSEWDVTWPNEWRATAPLHLAAAGAFQGWSGFTIHTYRYRTCGPVHGLGGVVMDGVGYRVNFDTFNDPAKFGLFYHAALLYRRGDVRTAEKTVGVLLPDATPDKLVSEIRSRDGAEHVGSHIPALDRLPLQHKLGLVLPGEAPRMDMALPLAETPPAASAGTERLSDTGELGRDHGKRIGWIDTPRTKAAFGFLGENEPVELDGLTICVKTPFAVIALSSLTDQPIADSPLLLLTAVGRADNTGARYNEDHTERLDIGHAPTLIEVIEARIALKTSQRLKVWSIDPEGIQTGPVPTRYADGVMSFDLGDVFPSMYYMLER